MTDSPSSEMQVQSSRAAARPYFISYWAENASTKGRGPRGKSGFYLVGQKIRLDGALEDWTWSCLPQLSST